MQDLAGIVHEVGANVTSLQVGDPVYGWSFRRSSHATFCLVPADQLIPKPDNLSFVVAGSLAVAGCTAYAQPRVVGAKEGETIAVSNAAGGVGSLLVQFLREKGCNVLGIASNRNKALLESFGVIHVPYGEGLAERLRQAAPNGRIDGFCDLR